MSDNFDNYRNLKLKYAKKFLKDDNISYHYERDKLLKKFITDIVNRKFNNIEEIELLADKIYDNVLSTDLKDDKIWFA